MDVEKVRAATDPHERIRLATEEIAERQRETVELGKIRRESVDYLRSQGMTLTDIAEQAGVSRARLSQLGTSRRAPERTLLSDSNTVTVAVDLKKELESKWRDTVHREHNVAFDILARTARRVGLEPTPIEHIEEPGLINLNRSGLIVVCGPRRAPIIAQILAADERYGFERDEQGWYLVDKASGRKYRSPEDSGQPSDYAYLGRLPRPDGHGHWLYMAGIHAPGGEAAAMYLDRELAELYRDVRTGRWSCLVEGEWDPKTHKMLRAELLAPVHMPGRGRARKSRV